MKALSTNNENATSASRPFDTDRDGFVMGEGSGALVLESLDHAIARGATILAELAGAACNNDAFHPTATHPEGIGAAKAMQLALADAGRVGRRPLWAEAGRGDLVLSDHVDVGARVERVAAAPLQRLPLQPQDALLHSSSNVKLSSRRHVFRKTYLALEVRGEEEA